MKLAINLTRENVGGITSSNMNLINYLYRQDYEFVGLELNAQMYIKGPVLFRNFAPEVFDHHIINIHDLPILEVLEKCQTLKEVEQAFKKPIRIIRDILKSEKPDVVLLSGTYYIPWLISIAAEREGIPLVLWYSGVLAKEVEHRAPHLKRLFASMEASLVRRADRIIFPSTLCRQVVEDVSKEAINSKSYVIPNPVASIFTEPCAVESSTERRIAAVGRYSRIKNFQAFFELHKKLASRGWRHTASFVTNRGTKIKEAPRTIEMLPPMNMEGLKKFYISQGLIVSPSLFETFGNVPMEAVCLGIPVLVNENMGCAEILKKVGLENMVMSFDDMDAVADRVQELCGQSILPKQLNALRRILDSSLVSEEIQAVIQDALQE